MVRKPAAAPKTRIDYSGLAFPKGPTKRTEKNRKDRKAGKTKADVKAKVFQRDRTCRAYGVSPICTKRPWDRHELIPVGRGGEVTTENAVAICRADHRACQNAVGGLSLAFDWPGKADGRPPNADRPGYVRAVWRGIWRGVEPTTERRTA